MKQTRDARGGYRITKVLRGLISFIFACILTVLAVLPATATELNSGGAAIFDPNTVYTYVSARARAGSEPAPVVIALHGMGSEGKGFCQRFLDSAELNGWIIIAPTFRYRNWTDPVTVAEDDVALTRQLVGFLDELPKRFGLRVDSRVSIIGFSRGAQLAHRFALAYPERTRSIAVMSAGTYTLPVAMTQTAAGMKSMVFPYGTADLATRFRRESDPAALAQVSFWVAVGAKDNNADDVPRQWDLFQGRDRVQRARAFALSLGTLGVPVSLNIFPNVGHSMSPDMVVGATKFVTQMLKAAATPPVMVDSPPMPSNEPMDKVIVQPPVPIVPQTGGIAAGAPSGGFIGVFDWLGILRRT